MPLASAVPLSVTELSPLTASLVITGATGAVVSICSVPAGDSAPERLALFPAPSLMVAPLRLTALTARSGVFCPAATV